MKILVTRAAGFIGYHLCETLVSPGHEVCGPDNINEYKPTKVCNHGNPSLGFIYIDDIVEGVTATLLQERTEKSMYSLYNIGNSKPVKLLDFISEIEKCTGLTAKKEMMPMQPGDVEQTWADVKSLQEDFGYTPGTSIERGVGEFVEWFKAYYLKHDF